MSRTQNQGRGFGAIADLLEYVEKYAGLSAPQAHKIRQELIATYRRGHTDGWNAGCRHCGVEPLNAELAGSDETEPFRRRIAALEDLVIGLYSTGRFASRESLPFIGAAAAIYCERKDRERAAAP